MRTRAPSPSSCSPLAAATPPRSPRRAGRARAPGPRDRLFPARAGDPRLRPLPRLHRDARREGQVHQRRAPGQHGRRTRSAYILDTGEELKAGDAEGRGDHRGRSSTSASRCGRTPRSSHPFPSRGAGRVGSAAHHRDLHGRGALPGREGTSSYGTAASAGRATRWCCPRMDLTAKLDPGHGQRDGRRTDPPRLREPAAGRDRGVDKSQEKNAVATDNRSTRLANRGCGQVGLPSGARSAIATLS